MANEATAEYYTRQTELNKKKYQTDYDQYLKDLATKFGISQQNLDSNLESRGILRSGEAGTAQARLGAANEAAITTAGTNLDYNLATADTNLATQLAGLQSSTPATPAPPKYDFSGIDFAGLAKWGAQIEKDKKDKKQITDAPGYNWGNVSGWG